ncbi:MAG: LTA synthase family protein, partial [Bacteroidales bacterium]|nr:LTA synthase family protein [Bacteroidales bacterium]
SVLKSRQGGGHEKRYRQMDPTEAEAIVRNLFVTENDTTIAILKRKPVNIVFILLESWSADLIASLGGESGITPCFAELEKEGLLLTQMYANGHRSQQGISVLLSGFPPVPVHNITDDFSKYAHLNSLVRDLKAVGYSSAFYFGGDLTYGNIKSYIMAQQFDKIIDMHDLPSSYPRGKLSIPDQYLFEYQLYDTKNLKEPFFSMLFTGSSHSPYDQPKIGEQLSWNVPELPYLNSAKYSDYALGEYFKKARKEIWYPNTLFVLIADHSHKTYRQWNYHSAEYQHIPMLLLGEVLKEEYRGQQWDKMVSQADVPTTLLRQLELPFEKYTWSQDIFNHHTKQFVPVETYVGFNWITPAGFIAYDAANRYPMVNTFTNDTLFRMEYNNCKAFLQYLYECYLNK